MSATLNAVAWLHYSDSPIAPFDPHRTDEASRVRYDKPRGFWVSAGASWREWRESESFAIPKVDYVHRVTFAPHARLLVVEESSDVRGLADLYPRDDDASRAYGYRSPNWDTIAAEYDGILIPEYFFDCRFDVMWYYGWDCASGCIWRPSAIESVALIDSIPRIDLVDDDGAEDGV